MAPLGARVTESKMVAERGTGTLREVDIAIESQVGAHEVLIGIECRDQGRPADVQWVDATIGKYQDLPIHKKVLVSRSGFTKGAKEKAKENNITTLTLDQTQQTKCVPTSQKRSLPVIYLDPKIKHLHRVFNAGLVLTGPLEPGDWPYKIFDAKGDNLDMIDWLKTAYVKWSAQIGAADHEPPDCKFKRVFDLGAYMLNANGQKLPIESVTIEVEVKSEKMQLALQAYNYLDADLLIGEGSVAGQPIKLIGLYREGEPTSFKMEVPTGFAWTIQVSLPT